MVDGQWPRCQRRQRFERQRVNHGPQDQGGGRRSAKLLQTFTVGLKEVEGDAKYNDLMYAKQVADLIGSTHHEQLMSTDEFLETIPMTIDAMDDLVSEPSSDLPTTR